jgi:hypothetical protein
MNEYQMISLITLIGALVLVGRGLRRRDMAGGKIIRMALIWVAIFAIAGLVFGLMQ